MSSKLDELYGQRNNPFAAMDEDESVYAPWKLYLQGDVGIACKLVTAGDAQNWQIPYLQAMVVRYDPPTGQLCLLCPGSGQTVFMDGRGLEELGDLIAEKRVKRVVMFDPDVHQPVGNDAAVVTAIKVEQS